MKENKNTQKIHFLYIISILIFIIIYLFSSNFADQEMLVDYISFALTITSLFLALISIIYAFYSNMSLSQTLSQLNNASQKVDETSNILSFTTEKLNQQIENIPIILKKLEGKLDNTHFLVSEVYNKGISNEEIANTNIPKDIFEKFYNYSSLSGLLALYAINLSFKHKKKFKLIDLEDIIPAIEESYTNGFLVACSSFGFFARQNYSEEWNIAEINKYLELNIEKELLIRINSMKSKDIKYLNLQKNLITTFFENENI